MIRFLLIALLTIPVYGYAWEMPPIPSLKEQYEDAKIEEVKTVFQSEPYFAGKLVEITMFGKKVKVDRTGEANATPPGTPPPSASPGLASLTDILDGLNAEAKGKVEINVERKWTEGGVLIQEKWGIIVGGQYSVSKEDKPTKAEKKVTPEE